VKSGGVVPTDGPVYVGIDLSLAKTGVVAIGGDGSKYWWRLHKPPPDLSEAARLAAHRWMLNDFFDSLPEPTIVGMEGYSFGSKGSSVFQIAQWGGVARTVLYDRHLDDKTVIMAPSTLKKYVTNNGNAPKNLVLREVYRVWGVEAEDDNVADAYGLARAVMTIHSGDARYAWQRDALRRTGQPNGARTDP
jgi:Holliday junction resolvasome RuvABC endonuclease subunit